MKKLIILFVLLLMCSFTTQAQFTHKDSVIIQTELKMRNLEYNFNVFQERRHTSVQLWAGGLMANTISFICFKTAANSENSEMKKNNVGFGCFFGIIGSGMLIAHCIIDLDNPKWLTTRRRIKHKDFKHTITYWKSE